MEAYAFWITLPAVTGQRYFSTEYRIQPPRPAQRRAQHHAHAQCARFSCRPGSYRSNPLFPRATSTRPSPPCYMLHAP